MSAQTLDVLVMMWLMLQLPLGILTGQALSRSSPRV
jgi:hypothetical protein